MDYFAVDIVNGTLLRVWSTLECPTAEYHAVLCFEYRVRDVSSAAQETHESVVHCTVAIGTIEFAVSTCCGRQGGGTRAVYPERTRYCKQCIDVLRTWEGMLSFAYCIFEGHVSGFISHILRTVSDFNALKLQQSTVVVGAKLARL